MSFISVGSIKWEVAQANRSLTRNRGEYHLDFIAQVLLEEELCSGDAFEEGGVEAGGEEMKAMVSLL